MKVSRYFTRLGAAMALSGLLLAQADAPALAGIQATSISANPAPTPEQIRALFAQVVVNQHRNDRAIGEFERLEHVVSREGKENSEVVSGRVDRVLPSGTGIMRLEIKQDGTPVSPEYHRRQLEGAIKALELVIHPNERYKQDYAKFEKRQQDRAELVDNLPKAFRVTWAGRETRGDRTYAKFFLEPDPGYKPVSRLTGAFEHVRVTVWVDESAAQVARIQAKIVTDIGFGGGLFGKIYRGGSFVLEQTEVEPGIWLPTLYAYDMDGRKFLFPFEAHERTETTQYRRVWPPSHAIEMLRVELNSLVAESPAR
jgi:hypothetical protein